MTSIRAKLFRQYVKWASAHTPRNAPIDEQRKAFENTAKMLPIPSEITIEAIELNGLYAEWLIPPDAARDKVILYLHGGGYAIGSAKMYRALVSRMAIASNTPALLLEYRLAPEHPFPAALDDASGAYSWLLEQGFSPENIVLMGESAGGGLVLSTLVSLRDSGFPMPCSAVVISPFTDLTVSGESVKTRLNVDPMNRPEDIVITEHYIGNQNPENSLISPLFADLQGLPPLYIQVGDDEIMLSDSTRLAEKAQKAGVAVDIEIWDEMWHIWHFFAPYLPEANQAIEKIGDYVQTALGKTSAYEMTHDSLHTSFA